ncbi:MAG: TolC family outer membrane protein [Alphaproteobacteria bacterium]|nr:TolC family outer membrane protein [Alphaproteobacteria bacterium]
MMARRFLLPTLTAALLAGVALPAAAQTFEEALASAYNTNPQIQAERANLRATDEQIAQARSNWRPTVTFTGQVGKGYADIRGNPSNPVEYSPQQAQLVISQPLYRGGRTVAAIDAAKNAIQAERARLFNTEQTVLLNAATAYLDFVQNANVVTLNMANERVLRRQLEATNDQVRVGEVTRTDVSQAEARLAGATANRIASEGTLETSRATFQQIIGIPALKLTQPPRPRGLPPTSDQAALEASTRNPLVVAAQFDEGAARAQIDVVRGALLPTLSLQGTGSYTKETPGSALPPTGIGQAAVVLSVPLYEAGNVWSQTRQARQVASQRLILINDARKTAIASATQAFETLLSSRARIESLNSQVQANEIALEGVRQEASVGSRTILDILNAEQELLNSQVSREQATHDDLVASFQVLNSMGRMTAKELALPVELYDFEANFRDIENRWFGDDILRQKDE